MSDTEIRMMRYTIEQLSAELQATRQYVSDIEQKLERTRKALDGAKKALNDIQFTDDGNRIVDIRSFAHHALEQITALEQKD